MRLHALYLTGALIAMASPLSAGAQLLPANDPSTASLQTVNPPAEQCAPGYVWEPGGYLGGGSWRAGHCASLSGTIDF